MAAVDTIFTGGTVVTSEGRFDGHVAVRDGRIAGLLAGELLPSSDQVVDVSGLYILPGVIDPHVHLRYPGNPARETFATGTMAAAAGGVTTILEHPISDPSVHSADVLRSRMAVCGPEAYVDYAFFGSAGEQNIDQIPELAQAGAIAFKSFLHAAPEGREREFFGLTVTNEGALCDVLEAVAATGRLAAVHSECNSIIQHRIERLRAAGRQDIVAHQDSRPVLAELVSTAILLEIAAQVEARLLFCHISGGSVARRLRQARELGHDILVETCPHYLMLTTDDTPALGPYARINPPIRSPQERQGLWEELALGTVDFIGSDHGPFLAAEKEPGWEDIWPVPCGAVGLETTVPLLLDVVDRGGLELEDLALLLSENVARSFDIYPAKGSLAPGADADLTVVQLGGQHTIRRDRMFTKVADTARLYDGWNVGGTVRLTAVRGEIVYRDGRVTGRQGHGQLVLPWAE